MTGSSLWLEGMSVLTYLILTIAFGVATVKVALLMASHLGWLP